MLRLYNAALWPLRGAAEILAKLRARDAPTRREWAERLGRRLPDARPGGFWLHGASVGEARLVGVLASRLRDELPGAAISVSALTPTGRDRLPAPPSVNAAFYAPLDFPGPVRRVILALKPRLLVLVETELWPNLLDVAWRESIPVCVVNARLSPERLRRYLRLRRLYSPLVSRLVAVGVQDAEHGRRFVELGVPSSAIVPTGNIKYDLPPPTEPRDAVRARLGIDLRRAVAVAGSTAEGEDEAVLDAFLEVRGRHPDALLVLAPRRPPRFDAAGRAAEARGLRIARRSANEGAGPGVDVLLVDALGELAQLYAAGDVAFVGGSLVPVGGHNLLEPAAAGVPVAFGPFTGHVGEPAAALLAAGGGARVPDAAGLARSWIAWLDDAKTKDATGRAAREMVALNRGALDRTLDLVIRVAAAERSPR